MKKVFMVTMMLFVGMFTYCYGQDVRVNINNQDATNNDCGYKINGICASEDIGGVEIQGLVKYEKRTIYEKTKYCSMQYALLTNYNDFTVTVLVEFYAFGIHSIVLKKNETKEFFLGNFGSVTFTTSQPSYTNQLQTKCMIVRKLGQ